MKSSYDSYLMRKPKPRFIGVYCGKPVYEGDNVNLKQLRQMPLRMTAMVNLIDDGGLSEDERKTNEMLAKQELQKAIIDIGIQKMAAAEVEGCSVFNLMVLFGLMFVFLAMLVLL